MADDGRSPPHIGPHISLSPEPHSHGPGIFERFWAKSNTFARSLVGYGDPELEAQCSPGEIRNPTYRGYLLETTAIVTGILATVATNALAGDGFSIFRCCACFAVAGYMAAADGVILQSLMFPRGVRDLRDGGVFIKLPSDADRTAKRIIAFRIAQSVGFGALIAVTVGLAINSSAIDARLDEGYLSRNRAVVDQALTEYNAQVDRARSAYDAQHGVVERLTKQQGAARTSRRQNVQDLERRIVQENQKLDQDQTALDQLIASRPERLHHAIESSPVHIPKSTSLVSRVKALFEEFYDDPFSAIPTILIDLLIIGLDTLNLCLGSIGNRGRYPAQFARRRLEELTEEARAAAALGSAPETSTGSNGAGLRRGPGRPRKDASPAPA
jgi:uncharacterized membrane protein YraQ (UPF0718 family)